MIDPSIDWRAPLPLSLSHRIKVLAGRRETSAGLKNLVVPEGLDGFFFFFSRSRFKQINRCFRHDQYQSQQSRGVKSCEFEALFLCAVAAANKQLQCKHSSTASQLQGSQEWPDLQRFLQLTVRPADPRPEGLRAGISNSAKLTTSLPLLRRAAESFGTSARQWQEDFCGFRGRFSSKSLLVYSILKLVSPAIKRENKEQDSCVTHQGLFKFIDRLLSSDCVLFWSFLWWLTEMMISIIIKPQSVTFVMT